MTDTDLRIIFDKLRQFEEELKKLESEVKVLNAYVDTQLQNKYHPQPDNIIFGITGCLICGKYDCPAATTNLPCPEGIPYALTKGSLVDSGTAQVWYQGLAKLGDDVEE